MSAHAEGHDDFDFEPVRGLPKMLPQGETMLWQGGPDAATVAKRVLHVRKIGIYFAAIFAWSVAAGIADSTPTVELAVSLAVLTLLAAAAVGLVALFAWGIARTTVYTLTQRRLVMRIGIALPITFNIPYKLVESASVKQNGDGTGDISLVLAPGERMAYAVVWPHARPWHFSRVQPTLRAIADVENVAQILARAVVAQPLPSQLVQGARASVRTPVDANQGAERFGSGNLGAGNFSGSAA
jgi:hypothetical protein